MLSIDKYYEDWELNLRKFLVIFIVVFLVVCGCRVLVRMGLKENVF